MILNIGMYTYIGNVFTQIGMEYVLVSQIRY